MILHVERVLQSRSEARVCVLKIRHRRVDDLLLRSLVFDPSIRLLQLLTRRKSAIMMSIGKKRKYYRKTRPFQGPSTRLSNRRLDLRCWLGNCRSWYPGHLTTASSYSLTCLFDDGITQSSYSERRVPSFESLTLNLYFTFGRTIIILI